MPVAQTNIPVSAGTNEFLVWSGGVLEVKSAEDSRTALGLGTMATQNADTVAITGGTISGLTSFGTNILTVSSANANQFDLDYDYNGTVVMQIENDNTGVGASSQIRIGENAQGDQIRVTKFNGAYPATGDYKADRVVYEAGSSMLNGTVFMNRSNNTTAGFRWLTAGLGTDTTHRKMELSENGSLLVGNDATALEQGTGKGPSIILGDLATNPTTFNGAEAAIYRNGDHLIFMDETSRTQAGDGTATYYTLDQLYMPDAIHDVTHIGVNRTWVETNTLGRTVQVTKDHNSSTEVAVWNPNAGDTASAWLGASNADGTDTGAFHRVGVTGTGRTATGYLYPDIGYQIIGSLLSNGYTLSVAGTGDNTDYRITTGGYTDIRFLIGRAGEIIIGADENYKPSANAAGKLIIKDTDNDPTLTADTAGIWMNAGDLKFQDDNTTAKTLTELVDLKTDTTPQLGGDLDANGNTIHFGTAENTQTPDGTTVTINLGAENHHTLNCGSATGTIEVTFTAPPGPTAGTIIIIQDDEPKDITWPVSCIWLGTEPTWSSDTSVTRIVSWRYNATNYYLIATEASS